MRRSARMHLPSKVLAAPASRQPEDDVSMQSLRRLRQLAQLVRLIGLSILPVNGLTVVAGAVFAEPRAVLLGVLALSYAVWLLRLSRQPDRLVEQHVLLRVAVVTLTLVAAAAVLEPAIGFAMAIAALLPCVMVLPFVGDRAVGRMLAAAGVVGVGAFLATRVVPQSSQMPRGLTDAMSLVAAVLAYGFLLLFLFEVGKRLKTTTDDLRSVVAMSNDIARTMDPQLVGYRIARHIAVATGASESGLCYWDRQNDRLVTMGVYPAERATDILPWYPLADFPATRVVLETSAPLIVDAADPLADQSEVAYLQSIGMRSMAMVPLIAAGNPIGTLELMSERSGVFSQRDVEMAAMLASEGAMALENARLYEEISHQALHDGLTGLANRVLFRDRVGFSLDRAKGREGAGFALLFIDLDDFKTLNDTLGHARGDEVLVAIGERVAASLRPNDTAARLGGDEFAVILDGVDDEAAAMSIAIRLADAIREPIEIHGVTTTVAASIGVAMSGTIGETADDLLRNADIAMYAAKSSSRGRAHVFQSALRVDAVARTELAGLLRGVEQRGELRLDYQPIVQLGDGAVVGLEALVRWQPPDRPLLMPDKFIDLAEQTGDIVPMGRWILREACRQVREWQIRLELPNLQVSVNLSARQFQEQDLVETVRDALAETELDPSSLILEITESGLMQRTAGMVGRLAMLRDLGVHLAIDDFGTGYSSLSYLERFPVDSLKIDRSFVGEPLPNGERSGVARAIVELGRTLQMRVVAEGIEAPDQAEWLMSLGCAFGQGYLYSRPLGVDATEAFLAADASRRAQLDGRPEMSQATLRRQSRRLRLVSGE